MYFPWIPLFFWIDFSGVQEYFWIIGRRMSVGLWQFSDNLNWFLYFWSNQFNYIGEKLWVWLKNSFNIWYIDYSSFITIGLVVFFVVIALLIIMRWLWPVFSSFINWNKKEQKWWLAWVWNLFSFFVAKISKYLVSFWIIIWLTLLITIFAKSIVDNGDYSIKNNNKLLVLNQEPLLFNQFLGRVKEIYADDKQFYTKDNLYWLTFFNLNIYHSTKSNNTKDDKPLMIWDTNSDINYNNITNYDSYNKSWLYAYKVAETINNPLLSYAEFNNNSNWNNYNSYKKFIFGKNKIEQWNIELISSLDTVKNWNTVYLDWKNNYIRKNKENVVWFNINFTLNENKSIGNTEDIGLELTKNASRIMSEVTNNKKANLTVSKHTYVILNYNLVNTNVLNTKEYLLEKLSNFSNTKLSYIFQYKYDSTKNKNYLIRIYICYDLGDQILTNKLNDKCIWLNPNEYNKYRTPIVVNNNKIIIKDYGSILSSLLLFKYLDNKNIDLSDRQTKVVVRKLLINANNLDLLLETLPLQLSYKWTFNVQTVPSNSSNEQLILEWDNYSTNLKYKYTPAFILADVYLEKILWKSSLDIIWTNNSEIKKYYNKYFVFAEGWNIKEIYINNDKNSISPYLMLNTDQIINLVWIEGSWNENPYYLSFISNNNSLTPLDTWINKDEKLFQKVVTFNKLVDSPRLLPIQIDYLIKGMLTSWIYWIYKIINPQGGYENYKNIVNIYSLLNDFKPVVFKSFIIWIVKLIVYFFVWIVLIISVVFSVVWTLKEIWKDKWKWKEKGYELAQWIVNQISNSKFVQTILIILWLSIFYLIYEYVLYIFVIASLIWIFLLGRTPTAEKEDENKKKEELAKITAYTNSDSTIKKIYWSALVVKNKVKDYLVWKAKWFTLRDLWAILVSISASLYAFVLISIIVYFLWTNFMIYLNHWQFLTFNIWSGIFPDIAFVWFVIVWAAAIFWLQGKISRMISWFIINQVSWQDSMFNKFMQSYLDSSTFNKVTTTRSSITEASIESMKVWLNKIEQNTENEKTKKLLQSLKWMKWKLDNWTDDKIKEKQDKLILVSDMIEKTWTKNIIEKAKQAKSKLSELQIGKKAEVLKENLKQKVSNKINIMGIRQDILDDEEIDNLLFNLVIDSEKKKNIINSLKKRWIQDEQINKFIKDIEKSVKETFKLKIKVTPEVINSLITDSLEWKNWRKFYDMDKAFWNFLETQAKILWINTDTNEYRSLQWIAETLYNKDINIAELGNILKIMDNDKDLFNASLNYIDSYLNGQITIDELKDNLDKNVFNLFNTSDEKKKQIIDYLTWLREKVFKKDVIKIADIDKTFAEISGWKRWYLSNFIYKTLYNQIQETNSVEFNQEQEKIVSKLRKEIDIKYPHWIPPEIEKELDNLEKTNDYIAFKNKIDALFAQGIIDGKLYKDIKDNSNIINYVDTLNSLLTKIENNDDTYLEDLERIQEILNKINPEGNKNIIDKINNFKELAWTIDIKKLNDMDYKVRWLTLNAILNNKKSLNSIVKNLDIPEDEKKELLDYITRKTNSGLDAIKNFFEWKINKKQLLGVYKDFQETLEKTFKKYNISNIKVGSEFALLVENLEKIKEAWRDEIKNKKEYYQSQAKQFSTFLYWTQDMILNNVWWNIVTDIQNAKDPEEVIKNIDKINKEILWLSNINIQPENIDLYDQIIDSLEEKKENINDIKIKKLEEKLANNELSDEQADIVKEELFRLREAKNIYKEKKKELIKNKIELEQKYQELKNLEMEKLSTLNKVKKKEIEERIRQKQEELEQITNILNKNYDELAWTVAKDNEIISLEKDTLVKIKESLIEDNIKKMTNDLLPKFNQFRSKEIIQDEKKNQEFEKTIMGLTTLMLNQDEIGLLDKIMEIKNKYVPNNKKEEFMEFIKTEVPWLLSSPALSHLLNSSVFNKIISLDKDTQRRIMEEINNGNKDLIKMIDDGTIKYVLNLADNYKDKWQKVLSIINTTDTILEELKKEFKWDDKMSETVKKALKSSSQNNKELRQKIKESLWNKYTKTEDVNKQKRLISLIKFLEVFENKLDKDTLSYYLQKTKEKEIKLKEINRPLKEKKDMLEKVKEERKEIYDKYKTYLSRNLNEIKDERTKEKYQEKINEYLELKKIKEEEMKKILSELKELDEMKKKIKEEYYVTKKVLEGKIQAIEEDKIHLFKDHEEFIKETNKNSLVKNALQSESWGWDKVPRNEQELKQSLKKTKQTQNDKESSYVDSKVLEKAKQLQKQVKVQEKKKIPTKVSENLEDMDL